MSEITRVAITGAAGRMGRTLLSACAASESVRCTAASEYVGHTAIGQDAGELAGIGTLGVPVVADLSAYLDHVDVVVDFTTPDAMLTHVTLCQQAGKRLVIGTTGLTDGHKAALHAAASAIAIVQAPNMSVGVNLCFKLAEIAAHVLDQADVEILEAHHRHKVDAPSGTALRLGQIIAAVRGQDLADCATYGRQGKTGERSASTIGFATVRAGDIVGEHTVLFADVGERVEITHKASSRMTFATGALRAARWLMNQPRGLFDMQDVLGLR